MLQEHYTLPVEDLYIWNKALIGGELISKESLKKIMDKHINVKRK